MSAHALALITKRNLRIFHMHPCKLTQLMLPNSINWNSKLTRNGQDIQLFSNQTRSYIYSIDEPAFKQKLARENIVDIFESDKDIIIVQNNNDWISSFANNKHLESEIRRLGYTLHNFKLVHVFREWYEQLFKLTPVLQIKYEAIKSKARATNHTQIICAQIRIGGKRPNVAFDYQYNSFSVTKLFWRFIRENLVNSSTLNDDDWKLFISTDTEAVLKEAVQEFGAERLIQIPGLFTHIDRESDAGEDCSRVEKTILDFHFMQNCDKAVVSKSGFGKLGVWNRRDPIKDMYVFEDNVFAKADFNLTV